MTHIINNPHALYYNGELIGIITNADPFVGGLAGIIEALNSEAAACLDDPSQAEARPMHPEGIAEAIRALPETIEVYKEEEDIPVHPNDTFYGD